MQISNDTLEAARRAWNNLTPYLTEEEVYYEQGSPEFTLFYTNLVTTLLSDEDED